MLNQIVLNIMVRGIKVKIERGEDLDDILDSYIKLNDEEKQQIRDELALE